VILNSKKSNEVYQILSMEQGRSFAQIDIDFLLKELVLNLYEEETKNSNGSI